MAPVPGGNQVDAVGQRSAQETARRVLRGHKAGLESRFEHDLLCEKFLLHIDGSGDSQWADILYGLRVEIPRMVSEYRKTENVLRLVVDNAVAHHTTMPLRYFADSPPDRRSREKALVDALWMNYLAEQQDLNALFADALYMAMPAGFCPVHRYWRDDPNDQYEPIGYGGGQAGPVPGMIDCWVGNPFDTVFDRAAKRGSVYWTSYGRVLPAQMVRDHFASIVPAAAGLQGTTNIPSAAQFQRIARQWRTEGLGIHGTPVISHRRSDGEKDEELILLLCREVLPGVEADWPQGRLQIVAVPEAADLRRGEGRADHALLLVDQPLPAGDFSWTLFYSHHRGEDVLGKPWIEDIDQMQVDLNIALSKRWEFLNKMVEAPIVAPGGVINEDMADIGGYSLLEVEPSAASWRPRVMEWPTEVLNGLNREAEEKRSAIYTGGGYQAASRGEAPGSRMAYRAILALQQADNTIHGPVNQRFRRSACDFARGCWRQFKAYGDIAWLLTTTGDEHSYLADPYVDSTRLSDTPPAYKLVNAFGASPELRAQEVLELMVMRGADGQPFMRTEEARRAYPNPMVFDEAGNPKAVQRRRAKTIAAQFHHLAQRYRAQTQMTETTLSHPWVQQAATQLFMHMEATYPRLRDDDLEAHLTALSEITQDETADPIARLAAMRRQELYYQWQASMAGMPVAPSAAGSPEDQKVQIDRLNRRGVAQQMLGAGGGPGSTLSDEQSNAPSPVATARG